MERSTLLHLDDWEDCEKFFNDPIGKENFVWGSPKSKNVDYKIEHPIFSKDNKGKPIISYIDQFPEPQSLKQGLYLNSLSESLEEAKNLFLSNYHQVIQFFQIIILCYMEEKHSKHILNFVENY